ncbi:MAG: right-handed parallel beta-helix repeat-containing protein, partial [Myxococcota bacterium]
HDGLLIENNTVREDVGAAGQGCWGIAVDSGYATAESFRHLTVRGNTVVNVGNIGIGVNACEDCVLENNVIVSDQTFGSVAISVPDRDRGADDLAMTRVTVRNNSVYTSASGSTGIRVEGEGSGHVVVSNAIHHAGSGAATCFGLGLAGGAYTDVDNNLCFGPNASSLEWELGSGDLAAWRAATSFDASSVSADPTFTSPSGPDYDLRPASASSPCVDAGHPTRSASTDISGAARDADPDIGAYEL